MIIPLIIWTLGFIGMLTFLMWKRSYEDSKRSPSYFAISADDNFFTNQDVIDYHYLLEKNCTNILEKLRNMDIVKDNCNLLQLGEKMYSHVFIVKDKIKDDIRKTIFDYNYDIKKIIEKACLDEVFYDMAQDIEELVVMARRHINDGFREKGIPIRFDALFDPDDQTLELKFYKMEIISGAGYRDDPLNIYKFTENTENGVENGFALIEYDQNMHNWLKSSTDLDTEVVSTHICDADGMTRTYVKIKHHKGIDEVKIMCREIQYWSLCKWRWDDGDNLDWYAYKY
jgi:hypothetical protein